MAQEFKVISDFYDFMLYFTQRIEKFPRHHRYSLGISMENRLQVVLPLLLRAKYSREKSGYLNEANIEPGLVRSEVSTPAGLTGVVYTLQYN